MEPTLSATLTGHIASGQIVFDEPLNLPEGLVVRVVVTAKQEETRAEADGKSDAPLREQLKAFLRHQIDDLPPDAATNHDHYLYGSPKR